MSNKRWTSTSAVTSLLQLCVGLAFLLLGTGVSLAQGGGTDSPGSPSPGSPSGAPSETAPDGRGVRNFGIASGIDYWAGNADFVARDGTPIGYNGQGYIFNNGGTANAFHFWAPLHLPQGALVMGLRLFYCDTNAANNPSVALTAYEGGTDPAEAPATNDLFVFTTAGTTPGCTSEFFDTDSGLPGSGHTIDYRNPVNRHYVILVNTRANDSTVTWKGVRVFWFRQISPAPVAPTFGDVPTTHGFFRFIEALAAAGITGGCGGGNYCPDSPLTRGQMAVFLSRALGLFWPPF